MEKDTGRSRGFGFVSYDSPDAAALAIKELNGFPVSSLPASCIVDPSLAPSHCFLPYRVKIGNKRLKVQHKQIRPSDQHHERSHHSSTTHGGFDMNTGFGGVSSLPPSGPMAAMSNSSWYGNSRASMGGHHVPGGGSLPEAGDGAAGQPQEPQQQVSSEEDAAVTRSNLNSGPEGAGTSEPSKSPIASPLSSLEPLRQALPDVGNGD